MTLRILHLEDNPDDAYLVQDLLQRNELAAKIEVAAGAKDYLAALKRGGFDLIVSDTSIPGFDVASALQAAQSSCREVPFIVLSGAKDSGEKAVKYRAAGATAYLSKDDLASFVSAVRRSAKLPTPAASVEAFSYARGMERLVETIQLLSLARTLEDVTKIVRRAARELVGADGATFVLRAGESCHYVDEDAIGPLWKGCLFPMSACISGWAMLHKEAAICEDIYQDARIPVDAYAPTFVKSLVMVPIRADSPIGAIGTYWAHTRRPTADEVKVLRALADSTSLTLENVQLYSELEQRVKERTAQYENANNELSAFSYSVSHDLRAPLRSIDGFSKILLRSCTDLNEDAKDKLNRIVSSAKRMSQLIDDLLGLSKVARAPLQMQTLDLAEIARSVAENVAAENAERVVEWDIEAPLPALGDPGLLRIVFENLLANAWKFSAKRAITKISIGRLPDEHTFFVRDNGAGFDSAQAEKLFGAFQRLHTEAEFPGTGIGLATVARIIHRHGGRVWAESQVDRGATFYFSLPANATPNDSSD